jgi:hypothetical protein
MENTKQRWTGTAPPGATGVDYVVGDLKSACEKIWAKEATPTTASKAVYENEGRYLPVATIKYYMTGPRKSNVGKFAWRKLKRNPRQGRDPLLGGAEVVLLAVIVSACVLGFGFAPKVIMAAGASLCAGLGFKAKETGGVKWFKKFKERAKQLYGVDIKMGRKEGLSRHRAKGLDEGTIKRWVETVNDRVINNPKTHPPGGALLMRHCGNSDEWMNDMQVHRVLLCRCRRRCCTYILLIYVDPSAVYESTI